MPGIDIRVRTQFFSHIKTKKLIKRLGYEGPFRLQTLWAHLAENHPLGDMPGWSAEDLALAAGWEGDPNELTAALLETGFIEPINGATNGFQCHDWTEHQKWIVDRPNRVAASQTANKVRWKKHPKDKKTIRNGSDPDSESESPSPFPSLPYLSSQTDSSQRNPSSERGSGPFLGNDPPPPEHHHDLNKREAEEALETIRTEFQKRKKAKRAGTASE